MVDVVGRLCQHAGCVVHPSFAAEHEGFARFCVSHKEEGMVNACCVCTGLDRPHCTVDLLNYHRHAYWS